MKQFIFGLLFAALFLGFSCGNGENAETEAEAAGEASEGMAEAAETDSPGDNHAICLWSPAGLREQPGMGKGNKYLANINFGEIVSLTGNREEVTSEKRNYMEVVLSDGKTGWTYEHLFALNAERGVAIEEIEIYERPDLTTFDGDKFNRGEIVAIIPGEKTGWAEAFGKEKKKSGWIQKVSSVSTDEVDVTVAILVDKAMAEKTPEQQQEALKELAENSTFKQSSLINMVNDSLAKVADRADLPPNQLYITTDILNVRSDPNNENDNIVFKLKEGDICTILEKGERVAIREMNDYWYKIEFEGKEGWVYGYFTSKKLME
ncbi:MAG: SH3 domain-containing protein [Bacteroidia bacterium]|nr:SH3 domain-containing protein [Bacteroidia bacterium]